MIRVFLLYLLQVLSIYPLIANLFNIQQHCHSFSSPNFILFVLLSSRLQIATMLNKMVVLLLSVYLVTADEGTSEQCITRGKLSIQIYKAISC